MSAACQKSEFYRNDWTDRARFSMEISFELFHKLCCKGIQVFPKIGLKVLPSGNLSKTLVDFGYTHFFIIC